MKRLYITCMLLGTAAILHANNISVSNVTLTGQNTSAGANNAANFSLVKFNLSWENSWRISTGSANWDAAWIFVKFRVGASDPTFTGVSSSGTTVTVNSTTNLRVGMPVRVTAGTGAFAANTFISSITNATQFVVTAAPSTPLSGASIECIRIWEHARINNTGHTAPSGSTIDAGLLTPGSAFNATTNPAVGVFMYRNANGSGTNTFNNTQLRWNYGANGINDNMMVSVQVFAIEMVFVPGAVDFTVGDGVSRSTFTQTTITTATANTAGGFPTGQTAPTNASWPNGYNSFYCMKYEISQGQFRDFLNTLTRTQQANRVTMDGTVGRYAGGFTWTKGVLWNSGGEVTNLTTPANRIGLRLIADPSPSGVSPRTFACDLNPSGSLPSGVNQSDDGECIAMGQLNWMDGCAYMEWAGLRPMTELEFEKACRGNQAVVSGENAWGNASTTSADNITNGGQVGEVTNTANANSASGDQTNVQGPLRVGMFAGAATTRAQAGATYYGIMEMSGNQLERVVTIGDATGLGYTGLHGDGILNNNGNATITNWPGLISGEVTAASGSGFRGGAWNHNILELRVSDRIYAINPATSRYSNYGFRGVRVSP